MAFVHGKGTKVHVNAVDFSEYFNNVDVTKTSDVAETTNFGSSGVKTFKFFRPGIISRCLLPIPSLRHFAPVAKNM